MQISVAIVDIFAFLAIMLMKNFASSLLSQSGGVRDGD